MTSKVRPSPLTTKMTLPPGEYGVYVYVKDPQGDPYYLFRVMVE